MAGVAGAAAVASAIRSSKGRHPLGQRLMAIVPMLRDTVTGRWPGAPRLRVVGGLAGIVYVLTPIDILPEVLLGPFGIADDLAMAAVSVAALLSASEQWLDARDSAASAYADDADVIQGVVLDRDR